MSVDFGRYHRDILPAVFAGERGLAVGEQARRLGSLGIKLSETGEAFSYVPDSGKLRLREGDDADTLVELSLEQWQGMVADLETAPALLYGNKLGPGSRGNMLHFLAWDPLLRSLYTGLPLYDESEFELGQRVEQRLDPAAEFSLVDDPARLREFLDCAGYLLLKNVFSPDEIAALAAAGVRLRQAARADDQASWWGRNAAGEDVVTRVLNGGSDPVLKALATDHRMTQMHSLMPDGLRMRDPQAVDSITVIFKTPTMKEGLSDLPWHRDCGMGGHAAMCPVINVSIYLEDATAAAGELRFLPGSHRFACSTPEGEAGIAVAARAGDVTLHHGDVMHQAPAPQSDVGPFRASVLLSFQPDFENHRGQRHYNDVLLDSGDGHVVTPLERVN